MAITINRIGCVAALQYSSWLNLFFNEAVIMACGNIGENWLNGGNSQWLAIKLSLMAA
jgi:hypothetical protein